MNSYDPLQPFLLSFLYFVHVSFLFTQKKKKLRQQLLSAAHAYYARLLVGNLLRHLVKGFVVLSEVFVVRLHRVVSPHYWRSILLLIER